MTDSSTTSRQQRSLDTLLMEARHIFRVLMLLNQVHSLDPQDGEALSTLALLGEERICEIETMVASAT